MGELVFRLILAALEIALEVFCYFTARLVVPALSFGKYAMEPLRGPPPTVRRGRPILISHDLGSLLGLAFWVLVIVVTITGYWLAVR